ncbi:hypothetical protein [Moorena sp. SIO4A5]|uniref:hypothetical protein n=1 Tax=Moorena sp. SIO4A5 TaxID=2607838 RepID=UPI0013C6AFA9|nr:hypothetical protein [Moorena sp. SIO4A5]NEO22245.1 hypothetical protein [Moorena sp. SIO4A5]
MSTQNPKSKIQNPFDDSFTLAFACAAITPKLRSILVFDTTLQSLQLAAQNIAQMLEAVTGDRVELVTLANYESEDNLWGSLELSGESEEQPFQWERGLLTVGQMRNPHRVVGLANDKQDTCLTIVVIPDLTKLSLAAARACVILMGADVAHLERHGHHLQWQPNLCWMAGCASQEVGMVSPHLLDRFALRLSGQITRSTDRVTEMLELLNERNSVKQTHLEPLSGEISQLLKQALQVRPKITVQALSRILNYTATLEVYSHRREIALARLSLANARLKGAAEMTAEHVNAVARMIGLKPVAKQTEKLANTNVPDTPAPNKLSNTRGGAKSSATEHSQLSTVKVLVYESDKSEALPSTSLTLSISYNLPIHPYPEDKAPVKREAASLKFPIRRFRSKTVARGPIVGVKKATTAQDLALVRTLLEAAKFQPIRQKTVGTANIGLILSPTDLYSYRRAPIAEQMLMLVLDHTCLKNCKWHEALLPYLSWAYVERASICLIRVGSADALHELQAEKVMAQSILTPRISDAIEVKGGKATPLAHGLDLALQTLRHALQHGRSIVQRVVLVVISDGRGNVPLEASRSNRKPQNIKRQGIEDALNIAKAIASLDNVQTLLLNPQSRAYPELPLELAKALGAKVVLIPQQETWELEP